MRIVGRNVNNISFIKWSIYGMDTTQGIQMYKFVTYKEWEDSYKEDHPFARSNPEKTEVVLTINAYDNEDELFCVDYERAFNIVSAWSSPEEEE